MMGKLTAIDGRHSFFQPRFDLSFFRHRYYDLKPHLPLSIRMAFRQRLALRALKRTRDVWPINPITNLTPQGWNGWPCEKEFAFVLTHDVEGTAGLEKCLKLAELDEEFGFRSSFNFIPEGEYQTPLSLREELIRRGFEVGVHDLRHDGKLYRSRNEFQISAARINEYLRSWQAVGFRSGFMHHKLDWLQALEIDYDMSTFDTDPFEPQPDGVDTIFPFWVPKELGGKGYIELPYTLAQDFTLFVLLKEEGIDIWKRKLAWIVEQGGMALVNVHPDYLCFGGRNRRPYTYSVEKYRDFLCHLRGEYEGRYWNALPKEVASFARTNLQIENHGANGKSKIEAFPNSIGSNGELRRKIAKNV